MQSLKNVRNNDPVPEMVESQNRGKIHHLIVIQSQIIVGQSRELFELPDKVIGKIPNSAAQKWREIRD
jgi:hypothetical protein